MIKQYKIEFYDIASNNWIYVRSFDNLQSAKYIFKLLSLNNPGAILRLIKVLEFRGN